MKVSLSVLPRGQNSSSSCVLGLMDSRGDGIVRMSLIEGRGTDEVALANSWSRLRRTELVCCTVSLFGLLEDLRGAGGGESELALLVWFGNSSRATGLGEMSRLVQTFLALGAIGATTDSFDRRRLLATGVLLTSVVSESELSCSSSCSLELKKQEEMRIARVVVKRTSQVATSDDCRQVAKSQGSVIGTAIFVGVSWVTKACYYYFGRKHFNFLLPSGFFLGLVL